MKNQFAFSCMNKNKEIDILGSVVDQEKDVSLFSEEMSLTATELVHLSHLKNEDTSIS